MTTRIWIDPWDPAFGSSVGDGALEESTARSTLDLEIAPESWSPITPPTECWQPSELLVVDGVRRIDAQVWFSSDDQPAPALGFAASIAAGVVRIGGPSTGPRQARIAETRIARRIYTSAPDAADVSTAVASYPIRHTAGAEYEELQLAIQQHMQELELQAALSIRNSDDDLMILDGPLRGKTTVPRTLGYIKTHHAAYLPPALNAVVVDLQPGQRTPVFTIGTSWSRHTWYLKLPIRSGSPWAGIVRCEAADSLSRAEVMRLADTSANVLPGLASEAHKDPRAPQNLVPIGGLEKTLRHQLGDPLKLHRALVSSTGSRATG